MAVRSTPQRRRFEREAINWPVLWNHEGAQEETQNQRGYLCDLAAGGAFVRPQLGSGLPTDLVGQRVCLRIPASNPDAGPPAVMWGTVRWRGQHGSQSWSGFGVEFDEPNAIILLAVSDVEPVIDLFDERQQLSMAI